MKPTVSLELLKGVMHYATFEEALEDLKQFGIVFEKKTEEEACEKMSIGTTEGLRMMQEYHHTTKMSRIFLLGSVNVITFKQTSLLDIVYQKFTLLISI